MPKKVSYDSMKSNTRLTDFSGLKDYVIKNSVKSIPRVIKSKAGSADAMLGSF